MIHSGNIGSFGLTGSGSANTLPIWTGGTSLGNSLISDNGTYYYTLSSRGLYVPDSWVIANDLRSRSGYIYVGSSDFEAIRGNDSWLRLNQFGQFSSGVHIPTRLNVSNRVDATIFYDDNNNGYYVDPASTSNLNNADMQGVTRTLGGLVIEVRTSAIGCDPPAPAVGRIWLRGSGC